MAVLLSGNWARNHRAGAMEKAPCLPALQPGRQGKIGGFAGPWDATASPVARACIRLHNRGCRSPLRRTRFMRLHRIVHFHTDVRAFVLTLVVLAATVWLIQALREFDLVSAMGQTIVTFLQITLLLLPALATVVARSRS